MRCIATLLLIGACLAAPRLVGAAQPSGLPPVPSGISPELTARLTKERADLVTQGNALQERVHQHHAQCAHLGLPPAPGVSPEPVDPAVKARCDAEQAQLDKDVRAYSAGSASYRNEVESAIGAGAAARNAYSARVVLKGGVELLQPSGQSTSLTSSRAIVLSSGERVVTKKYARASFQLPDNTQFILGPETEITFDKMVNNSNPAKRQIAIKLTKGTIRWTSGDAASAKVEMVSLLLPAVTIAVRGADMQGSIAPGGDGYIALMKGSIMLTTTATPSSTISLQPGEIVTFTAAGAVANPRPMQAKEVSPL